jgi:hypothetical protein
LTLHERGCRYTYYKPLFVNIPHWKEVREMIQHLRRFDSSDIAKERLKIISYYQKYGERATKEALPKKLLVCRKMMIDYKIFEVYPGPYLRESHYRLGKAKEECRKCIERVH